MAHWRDTYRTPRLFMIDARAAIPLLASALHVAWWTVLPAVMTLVLFFWLERIGLSLPSALRALRATFAGNERPALSKNRLHQSIDYDRREIGRASCRERVCQYV